MASNLRTTLASTLCVYNPMGAIFRNLIMRASMQLPDLLFAFIALKIIETLSWKHVTFNVDAIPKLLCVRHAEDMHASWKN